jgi:glutamate dehydrogenase
VLRACLWFLRRRAEKLPIAEVLALFAPGVSTLASQLTDLLSADDLSALRSQQQRLVQQGVPESLASAVAHADSMYSVLDIVEVSAQLQRPVEFAAGVYHALVGQLALRWVSRQIGSLPTDSHWQALARAAMRDDLANLQRHLTESVMRLSPQARDAQEAVQHWERHHAKALARMQEVMDDLKIASDVDLAMLSVLLRELRVLT